jgi:hypothetical protein
MGLAPGTRQKASISYRDAGNEIGVFSCYGAVITDVNFAAQAALWATVLSTADALTLGARVKDVYNDTTTYATVQPTNGAAREIKLLVQYQVDSGANAGARWTSTLPTLDTTLVSYVININAKDVVDPSVGAALLAFIAAFEAFALDPAGSGAPTSVVGLKVVGRSN